MNLDALTRAVLELPEPARRTLRARISRSLRTDRLGGRLPTCECGACPKCRNRERMRMKRLRQVADAR